MQGGCECCLEWARANIVTKQTVSQKAAARMVRCRWRVVTRMLSTDHPTTVAVIPSFGFMTRL